ncbi:MAG: MFS transporter [Egibacteraceae bacterium]
MLRDPAIRRVALARFISATGAEAAFIVGIWGRAAYDFQASPAQLALLMGVLGLCGLAGSAVAGVLVDRYGPRRVVMAGEALFAPATLALVLPTAMAQLTLLVAAVGFLGFVVYTAISAFPPLLVTEPPPLAQGSGESPLAQGSGESPLAQGSGESPLAQGSGESPLAQGSGESPLAQGSGESPLMKANAALELAHTAAFIGGPAIGALLATVGSLDWVFVLDAATSLVAVALVAGLAVRTHAGHANREHHAWTELREGARFTYGVPVLRFSLVLGMVVFTSFGAFAALEPLFFREVLGTGPEALGWMNALFGAGLAAGSLLADRWSSAFISVRAVMLLSLGCGLGAVAYTGTANLWVVAVAAPAWGAVLGMLFPALRTLIQLHTPDALLGRATGVLHVHQQLGELLPLVLMPAMAAAWGVQLVLVGSGVALTLVCALLLPVAARLDRQRSVPARLDQGSGESPTDQGSGESPTDQGKAAMAQ